MTTEQVARMFERPHREGKGYRARCPVHGSKGSTLGIYPKEDRTILVCYAGCSQDDILASVKLTWKDTLFVQRDSKAWREERRKAKIKAAKEYRDRIRSLVTRFRSEGYTTLERDMDVAVATVQMMAEGGSKPHLEKLLAVHMERITAAQIGGLL